MSFPLFSGLTDGFVLLSDTPSQLSFFALFLLTSIRRTKSKSPKFLESKSLPLSDTFIALTSPFDLTEFNEFQDQIHFLARWVVDNFDQPDNVRVPAFLQDGDFALDLLLLTAFLLTDLSEPRPRIPFDDLDRNEFVVSKEVPTEFNLTVDASTDLVDDFVRVYGLAAGYRIEVDVEKMGFLNRLSMGRVEER